MAGQQSRTVTLTLDAQTTGLDGVKSLASELGKLAKKGGEAAPEFERISKELNSVVEQQHAVTAFNELSSAVNSARQSSEQARQALKTQRDELDLLKQSTDKTATAWTQVSDQMRAARSEVQQSNTNLLQARAAVTAYVSAIGGANSATREQTAKLKELRQAVLDAKDQLAQARVAVSQLTPEYDRMKAAAGAAANEVKQQENAIKSANEEVERAKTRYESLESELKLVSGALQKMGVDTNNVVGEQNRLQQSLAKLSTEATTLKTKLDDPGQAARTTGQQISDAFGVVGVRSVNAIRTEIMKVNSALMTLAQASNVSADDFNRAFSSGKAKIKELEAELKQAEGASKSFTAGIGDAFKQFGPATLVFNGITAAISAFTGAASKIPKVTAEFQTMNRVLTVLTGSTAAAAKEFEYIKGVANRVGSDIKSVGEAYVKLAAATKDTALEGAQTKRIFEAVAGSMGMLGAASHETAGALMAITQMVSKGVVSMEEMRQQLGERLPGAFQVVAKELGITTGDLNDLISSGKMTAEQILPALAKGLENLYKSGQQNDTLVGKWAQFTNALKESANAMGDSGLVEALLKVARIGSAAAQGLAEDFLLLGKSIGIIAAGIRTGDLSGAMAEIGKEFDGVNARMAKTAGIGQQAQKSMGDLARDAKAAGREFVDMGDGVKIAVAAIEGLSTGVIKFLVDSNKAEKQAESFATSARKVAEYTRSAGEASISAANALGDEIDKRNTATHVAEDNQKALQKLLDAERAVLDIQEKRILRLVEEVAAKKNASDADQKIIQDLEKEIKERMSVVSGLGQQVEANRVLAESLKIQAETVKDNSNRVVELRVANEQLQNALKIVRAEVEAGNLTQAQANVVEEEARKTKRLLGDALDDQKEKTKALNAQKQGEIDMAQATIRLSIAQQQSIYDLARATGDEYTAKQALMRIKEYEVQMAELTAKAKRAEAQAALLVIQADREELQLKGLLTEAKAAELRARELAANVKLKEADIADELARNLRNLANATNSAAGAAQASTGSYDSMAASMNKAADAARNLRAAQGDTTGAGMQGQFGTTGSGSVTDNPAFDHGTFNDGGHQASRTGDLKDMLYKQGATVEEAEKASKYMGELMRRMVQAGSANVTSTSDNVTLINRSAVAAARQAINLARVELAGGTVDIGPNVADLQQRNLARLTNQDFSSTGNIAFDAMKEAVAAAGREARDRPAVVTINLNGKTQKVNMSSEKDASGLVNILKQLENDSARY